MGGSAVGGPRGVWLPSGAARGLSGAGEHRMGVLATTPLVPRTCAWRRSSCGAARTALWICSSDPSSSKHASVHLHAAPVC